MYTTTATPEKQTTKVVTARLLSLDVMRGIIMILLAGEACRLYDSFHELSEGTFLEGVARQFSHHPWNGLRFWDLIQPAFMTMAGTAMYLSFIKKQREGVTWANNFKHIAIRCLKLFICGTGLHCIYAGRLVWELWNVLTQLSVTTIIAYLFIRKSPMVQIVASIGLLLLTELLYRTILVPGFDQPFVEYKNFGAYMDTLFMGKINNGGWVTINILPTAAHTIWGCVIGWLLVSDKPANQKIKLLLMAGGVALLCGFGLDWLHITPIIKRIATSSFVLASGGWVFLMMAFVYWLVDVKKKNKYAFIPVVVGMNSIFIYLVFETVGVQWINKAMGIFVKGFSGMIGTPAVWQGLLSALAVWALYWFLCNWLYKRKIFFKL